jgi:hypothetical protein
MYPSLKFNGICIQKDNTSCLAYYSGSETRSKAFITSSRSESGMNPLSGKKCIRIVVRIYFKKCCYCWSDLGARTHEKDTKN